MSESSKTWQERFRDYWTRNPRVWELFERFALEAARSRRRFGAHMIWQRMRWFENIEVQSDTRFKLTNHWFPYYARVFAAKYPAHASLFQLNEVQHPFDPTEFIK